MIIGDKMKIKHVRQASHAISPLELEKTQLALVKWCRMHRHEQLREYAMFCTEFYRYCETLKGSKNKWSLQVHQWVLILVEYSTLFMFPSEYASWLHLGRKNHSVKSIQVALVGCKSWLHDEMKTLRSENNDNDSTGS
jgi:hypothetical protein